MWRERKLSYEAVLQDEGRRFLEDNWPHAEWFIMLKHADLFNRGACGQSRDTIEHSSCDVGMGYALDEIVETTLLRWGCNLLDEWVSALLHSNPPSTFGN